MKLNFLCAHLQWIPEYFVSSVSLHVKLTSETRVLSGGWGGDDQIVHFQQSFELPNGMDENLNILVDLVAVLNDTGSMTRTIGSGAVAIMYHDGPGRTRMVPLFSSDSDIIMAQLIISTNDCDPTREDMEQLFPRERGQSSPATSESSQVSHAVGDRGKCISFSSSRISCLTPHSVQRWQSTAKGRDHAQAQGVQILTSSSAKTEKLSRASNPSLGVVRGNHRIVERNVAKEAEVRTRSSGLKGKATEGLHASKIDQNGHLYDDGADARLTPVSDSRSCGLWSNNSKSSSGSLTADAGTHVDRILRNSVNIRNSGAVITRESSMSKRSGMRNVIEPVSQIRKSPARSDDDNEGLEQELDLDSSPDSTSQFTNLTQKKGGSFVLTHSRLDKSCVLKANDAYCRVRDLLNEKNSLLRQAHSQIDLLSDRDRDRGHKNDTSSMRPSIAVTGGFEAKEVSDVRYCGDVSSSSPLRHLHRDHQVQVYHQQAQGQGKGQSMTSRRGRGGRSHTDTGVGVGVNRSLSAEGEGVGEGDATDGDTDQDADFSPPVSSARMRVTIDRGRQSDDSSGQRPNISPPSSPHYEPVIEIEPFNRSTRSLSGCRGSESIDPILDMQMRLKSAEKRRARILRNTKEKAALMAARAKSKSLAVREAVLRSSQEFDEMRNRIDRQGDRDRLLRERSRSSTRPLRERSYSTDASYPMGMRGVWGSRGQGVGQAVGGKSGGAVGVGRRASSVPRGRAVPSSPSIPYSDLRLRSRSVTREDRDGREDRHMQRENRYDEERNERRGSPSLLRSINNSHNSSNDRSNSNNRSRSYPSSRATRYVTNSSVSSPLVTSSSSTFPPPSSTSSFSPNTTTEHSTNTSTVSGRKWSGKALGRGREEERPATRCSLRTNKVHIVPPSSTQSQNASTRTSTEYSSSESQNILVSLVLERIEDLQRGIATASKEEAHSMLQMIERLVPLAVAVNVIIKSSVDALGGNAGIDQIRKTYDSIVRDESNSSAMQRNTETVTVDPVPSIPDPIQDPQHVRSTTATSTYSNIEKRHIRSDTDMRNPRSRFVKQVYADNRVTPAPSLRENRTTVSPVVPISLNGISGSQSPPYAVKNMGDVDMCGSPFQGVRMYSESSSSSSEGSRHDNTGHSRYPLRDAISSSASRPVHGSRSKHLLTSESDCDSTSPDVDNARLRYVHRSMDALPLNREGNRMSHHRNVNHSQASRTGGPIDHRNTYMGVTPRGDNKSSSMWAVGENEDEDGEEYMDEEEVGEDEGEGVEELSVTSGGFSLDIAHVATAIDHLQTRISSYLKSAPTVTPPIATVIAAAAASTAPLYTRTMCEKKEMKNEESLDALNRRSADSIRPKGTAVDRDRGLAGPHSPLRNSPPRNNAHLSFTAPRILSTPIPDSHSDLNMTLSSSDHDSDDDCYSDSDVSSSHMNRIGSVSTISAYEKEKEKECSIRVDATSSYQR